LYPFIVGDVLKIVIAAVLLPAGWKLLAACGILNSKF
jgi:biotin transporter BioY